jgi:FAD/FMN-containing dehydrogenase
LVAAVSYARKHGLEIAVHSGGHGCAATPCASDGVMIDLRPMKRIEVDAARRRALVQVGVAWRELAATQRLGLAVTGGRVSSNSLHAS